MCICIYHKSDITLVVQHIQMKKQRDDIRVERAGNQHNECEININSTL